MECACGNKFTIGSTKPKIEVEICSNCHPFYTGKEKMADIVGKVERFRKRKEKASAKEKRSKTVKRTVKKAVKKSKKSSAA